MFIQVDEFDTDHYTNFDDAAPSWWPISLTELCLSYTGPQYNRFRREFAAVIAKHGNPILTLEKLSLVNLKSDDTILDNMAMVSDFLNGRSYNDMKYLNITLQCKIEQVLQSFYISDCWCAYESTVFRSVWCATHAKPLVFLSILRF